MALNRDADLVILGAGCAGLSLAAKLAVQAPGLKVELVESRTAYVDDRSWCFWRPMRHDLSDIVSKTWSSWRFSTVDGREARHSVPGLAYQYIRGEDFYARSREVIESSSNVTLNLGRSAGELTKVSGGIRVDTDQGDIVAANVIDTRPQRTDALLFQCFVGVEIRTAEPHGLDLNEVGLMTRMESDSAGLGFVYALPLSADRALIEWTRFSAVPVSRSDLSAGLDLALARLGFQDARILRTEGGTLPMGRAPRTEESLPGVFLAGNTGGGLRAASGFGFLRIGRWADACAVALAAGRAPFGHPPEPWARREMDRIFLQAVREHPERTADYFAALATGVQPAGLVRFLSDSARPWDYARIIASLPLLPFLAQIPPRPALFRAAQLVTR
jgi:lycopene beta-cyclase